MIEFATWKIEKEQLDSEEVRALVAFLKMNGHFPKGGSPNGQGRLFE